MPGRYRIIIADFTKFGNTDALQFANTAELTVTTMEQAEGPTPAKVRAMIVTNKPNTEEYKEYRDWLISRGTGEKLMPTFGEIETLFDMEIKQFREYGIEIDIVE